jgi:SlyX protein
MDDQRLIDIETKIAYQEHMISELNAVICEHQKSINELEKTVRHLLDRVLEQSQHMSLQAAGNEKPPHY